MQTRSVALMVALLSAALAAAEPPLTNADVVKLVKAGVSAEVIVAKIQASETAFATDADSLVALANEKVPNSVIQAMMARTTPTVAPTAAPPPPAPAATAPPEPPGAAVNKVVVHGIYRTRGICTARGVVTMTPKTFAFTALEKSPLCSEDAFGKSNVEFPWSDIGRLCFEYAASGTVQVWLTSGEDMSFKATRGEMEDLAARMKSLHANLPVRCED